MNFTTEIKIEKIISKTLISQIQDLKEMLLNGNLKGYEESLSEDLLNCQNEITEELLKESAEEIYEDLCKVGKEKGGKKIVKRSLSIKTSTGYKIEVLSPYVKLPKKGWQGSRHLLSTHWNIIGGSSPLLYDKVGYCTLLCPSYDLAHQALMKFGVTITLSSVQDTSTHLSNHCYSYGEEELQLEKGESLAKKRVVISLDGGRSCTREYKGEINSSNHKKYKTLWKEPKLFVIDVLDEKGKVSRYELPIYGCRFEKEDLFSLLKKYLIKLDISKAKSVQILADGAPWIWNNMKPLLLELNVPANRITETLDYYHACEYVHRLVSKMPKSIKPITKKAFLKQFKTWLWDGESAKITAVCKDVFIRPSKLIKRYMNYLEKHQVRTQYADYEEKGLMCGSGIVESAIRRIINLRFKNASTFWKKERVEKLYFLRAALLSKRWDLVMNNLANSA